MTDAGNKASDEDGAAVAERLLYENVAKGYMEVVGVGEDGEPLFRLTEAGRKRVDALIHEERR